MDTITEQTIDAISIALDELFNTDSDEYEIYTESIEQGLKEPCFIIQQATNTHTKELKNRYKRQQTFDIAYIAKDKINSKKEINQVIEKLYDGLELIKMGQSLIRGSDMSFSSEKDEAHFLVDYNLFISKEQESETMMEKLSSKGGLKSNG